MSNKKFILAIVILSAIYLLSVLGLTLAAFRSNSEKKTEECATLAAIGVKAGDNITIYGDMPTWKIACLMGDGDN